MCGGTFSYVQWNNVWKEYQAFSCLMIWVPPPSPPAMKCTRAFTCYTGNRKTKREGSGGAIAAVSAGRKGDEGYTQKTTAKKLCLFLYLPLTVCRTYYTPRVRINYRWYARCILPTILKKKICTGFLKLGFARYWPHNSTLYMTIRFRFVPK